jgi:glutamate 5-kinase
VSTMSKQALVESVRRVVVKIGSSLLASGDGIHEANLAHFVAELAALRKRGLEVIVVSSGARAAGLKALAMETIPNSIPAQQAAAAVGQIHLMAHYARYFAQEEMNIAQVLLTAADIAHRGRYLNAKHTIDYLLERGLIPIINENDSVAVDELKFGDNDRLSALVAGLCEAQLLILLTDVEGLYDKHPKEDGATLIPLVEEVSDTMLAAAQGQGTLGTGGMLSKLEAAKTAARRGIPTMIAKGVTQGVLMKAFDPKQEMGTLVLAAKTPLRQRKHWIGFGVTPKGQVVLDAGACRALVEKGTSLLPAGIVEVRGAFEAGECVSCLDEQEEEIARGLVVYDARDLEKIIGAKTSEIETRLGYHFGDEIIHRDDLVLARAKEIS